ncbi:hypothetical protein QY895_08625 [Latilactobacillus sakei]
MLRLPIFIGAGRTGRMGREGTVLTLGNQHDGRNLRKLLAPEYDLVTRYLVGDHLEETKPSSCEGSRTSSKKCCHTNATTNENTGC